MTCLHKPTTLLAPPTAASLPTTLPPLQALQLYIATTALTMLLQQCVLRLAGFRRWYGFPDDWPLPPERVADIARKRGITMFKDMAPLFRRFSALGEGDFRRFVSGASATPQQIYVSKWGLRDPGIPPPPPMLAVAGGDAAAAMPTLQAAAAAPSASSSAVAGAALPSAAPAPVAQPLGTRGKVPLQPQFGIRNPVTTPRKRS